MKTITSRMLRKARACEEQYELFHATFGDSVEVTESNCLRAAKVGLDIEWAAEHLLSDPAREEYGRAVGPARKEYMSALARAFFAAFNGESK